MAAGGEPPQGGRPPEEADGGEDEVADDGVVAAATPPPARARPRAMAAALVTTTPLRRLWLKLAIGSVAIRGLSASSSRSLMSFSFCWGVLPVTSMGSGIVGDLGAGPDVAGSSATDP
jgi:hypothetical protein